MSSFVESILRSSSSVCSSVVNQPAGVRMFSSSSSATTDESYASLPDKATVYSIWVSFAEVYNERVYDLFDSVTNARRRRRELKIFQDKQGHVYIKGTIQIQLSYLSIVFLIISFLLKIWRSVMWILLRRPINSFSPGSRISSLLRPT